MVSIQPKKSATDEEAPHLVPSIIEDKTAPIGMQALLRVGMLVDMRSIEESECMLICGKV
jgi:hypothetical protein